MNEWMSEWVKTSTDSKYDYGENQSFNVQLTDEQPAYSLSSHRTTPGQNQAENWRMKAQSRSSVYSEQTTCQATMHFVVAHGYSVSAVSWSVMIA